jgi:hypothetical protein
LDLLQAEAIISVGVGVEGDKFKVFVDFIKVDVFVIVRLGNS